MTSTKSVSVTSVGSVTSLESPMKTVPEPTSIMFVPAVLTSKSEPPPSSPVSAVSPFRAAFCVALG